MLRKERKEQSNDFKIDTFEIRRANSKRLSRFDLITIIKEYKKSKGAEEDGLEFDVNYEKIDRIIKELIFFSKYSKNERITIIRRS